MHSPLEVSAASEVADVVERVQSVGVGVGGGYLSCLDVQCLHSASSVLYRENEEPDLLASVQVSDTNVDQLLIVSDPKHMGMVMFWT